MLLDPGLHMTRVLGFDLPSKVIEVEPGARWLDVQHFAWRAGATVAVMQASYLFSVGGSLGTNVHGTDHLKAAMAETVDSVRVVSVDGGGGGSA